MRDYLSNYPAAITNTRNIQAQLQVTITALALQQYRYDYEDSFPATLITLTPTYLKNVPFDPFLPKHPLKYHHDKSGGVIYSIGQDQTDNNGLERTPDDLRTRGQIPTDNTNEQPKNLTDITISFLDYQKNHFPRQNTSPNTSKPTPNSSDQTSVLDDLMMDF